MGGLGWTHLASPIAVWFRGVRFPINLKYYLHSHRCPWFLPCFRHSVISSHFSEFCHERLPGGARQNSRSGFFLVYSICSLFESKSDRQNTSVQLYLSKNWLGISLLCPISFNWPSYYFENVTKKICKIYAPKNLLKRKGNFLGFTEIL